TVASANPRIKNYELQHRNNPRRHRDPLRPDHLHHQRAACAGRSHPARAGDYFRGTRKRKFEKQLKNSELLGDRAERPDSATLSRDDLRLFMRWGTGTRISFAKSTGSFWVGSRPLNGGYIIFGRQSIYPTSTAAMAAKSQEVVHLCQTFRAQNNPLFGSNSVKSFICRMAERRKRGRETTDRS